ncbi:MAG: glucosaminidase domain-containing protein [Bacilli bacterium]
MEQTKKLLILVVITIAGISLNHINNKNVVSNQIKKTTDNTIDLIKNIKETKIEEPTNENLSSPVVYEDPVLYEGLTKDQVVDKASRMLNGSLTGTSDFFVSYSIEKGVDPLMAIAIVLQETGCYWGNCSSLVNDCYNVGGMMGSNGYMCFSSLEEGIRAYIDNLYNNYVSYGLSTPYTMNSKYAADPLWAERVTAYIERIKAA